MTQLVNLYKLTTHTYTPRGFVFTICICLFFNRSETSHVATREREEQRLTVFEKRILRKIFGPARDEVAGYWITIHKKKINI